MTFQQRQIAAPSRSSTGRQSPHVLKIRHENQKKGIRQPSETTAKQQLFVV
jgi:hypothetical protein